jgi:hypothetical protein
MGLFRISLVVKDREASRHVPRMSAHPRIAVIICLAISIFAINLRSAQGAIPVKPLEHLLEGEVIPQEKGYEVSEVRLGDQRVTHLFDVIPIGHPGDRSNTSEAGSLRIKAKNSEAMAELKKSALVSKELTIKVIMIRHSIRCHFMMGLISFPCEKPIVVPIPFTIDSCTEITRTFYTSIEEGLNGMIHQVQVAGDSDVPIELDRLFSLLLADKLDLLIKNKMSNVDPQRQCVNEFGFLKWLRNEEAAGFKLSEYGLEEGLKDVLAGIAGTLKEIKWERYHFEIEIIGYTDQSEFQNSRAISPRGSEEMAAWSQMSHPPAIYYKGCKEDRVAGEGPTSIDFGEKTGTPVGGEINDNCDLGAIRGYVAANFLRNMLGSNVNIKYKYGTGGRLEATTRSQDYKNRKVHIRLVAKSGQRSYRTPIVSDVRFIAH